MISLKKSNQKKLYMEYQIEKCEEKNHLHIDQNKII
jgi:hypothetical protein